MVFYRQVFKVKKMNKFCKIKKSIKHQNTFTKDKKSDNLMDYIYQNNKYN